MPYASKVRAKDDAGRDVGVMHACGHDVHMASLLGTAEVMARSKKNWHGTLILIGQPAEETIGGAEGMLRDGLFTRFPKPDVHCGACTSAMNFRPGTVSITPGIYNTNSDSIRITIYGKGGHGAAPHTTVDPNRHCGANDSGAANDCLARGQAGRNGRCDGGYIHAGTKNNIIPDHAEMGLTVRTYKPEVRKQILASIARIAKARGRGGGRAARAHGRSVTKARTGLQRSRTRRNDFEIPTGSSAGKGPSHDARADHAVRRFLVFCGAGNSRLLLQPRRRRPAEVRGSESLGKVDAVNHSPLFAPDVEPSMQGRHRCGESQC